MRSLVAGIACLALLVGCSSSDDAASTTSGLPGDPSAPTTGGSETTDDETTSTGPTTTTIPPTTTTTIPLVTTGAVVLVANAAEVPGAAGRLTGTLTALGFTMAEPTNGDGPAKNLDTTSVYAKNDPGAQAVAESIARLLGVTVQPWPTPVPIEGATLGVGDATVLIVLGRDLADQPLPGL
jgi:hypothetical protein